MPIFDSATPVPVPAPVSSKRSSLAWLWALGLVVVGLVGMTYHFVGDTVGGACLGTLTGVWCGQFFGLRETAPP